MARRKRIRFAGGRPAKRRRMVRRRRKKRVPRKRTTRASIGNLAVSRAANRSTGRGSDKFAMSLQGFKKTLNTNGVGNFSTSQSGTGIPKIWPVRQTFTTTNRLLGDGVATIDVQSFRLNSTFASAVTLVGSNQPKGRDFCITMYSDYTVIGCEYVVTCRNIAAVPQYFHVEVSGQNPSEFETLNEIKQEPLVKSLLLSSVDENDGQEIGVLRGYARMARYVEPTTGNYRANFFTDVAANPTQTVFLHVLVTGDKQGSSPPVPADSTMVVDVQLTYHVVYSSPLKTTRVS